MDVYENKIIKIGKIIRSIEIFVLTPFAIPEKYFKNLEVKDLSDNRKFWKTIKPYRFNKIQKKLLLKEKRGKKV